MKAGFYLVYIYFLRVRIYREGGIDWGLALSHKEERGGGSVVLCIREI